MQLEWFVEENNLNKTIKSFLKNEGFSNRLLRRILADSSGKIMLNGKKAHVKQTIEEKDTITVCIPGEDPHPYIEGAPYHFEILFEDKHYLIINKPAGTLSSPVWENQEKSIANQVLQYYIDQQYEDLRLHIVTRLDRETSGVMIFAKHQLAHAKIDQLNQDCMLDKYYLALTPSSEGVLNDHGLIEFPIGRKDNSIIEREVRQDGRLSLTEYWRLSTSSISDLFRIQLHTGRTHQIRVHFSHLGLPLLGDTLYGPEEQGYVKYQALHCEKIIFEHPFTQESHEIRATVPADMKSFIEGHFN